LFSRRSRKFYAQAGSVALVTGAASLAIAGLWGSSATATTGSHSPKGDNGTVKVHRTTTSADDPRNEPHVCGFYLDGFNFDAGQQVSWRIVSWPPTGNRTEVLHGTLTLDQDGHGRTNDLSLANGHYKLYWNFNGENGRAKQKVFWVKCGSTDQPTPSPTSTASTPTAPPSASPSTPTSPAPVPTPVPTDLPVTG
jgi:hypothetical protein